MTAAVGRNEAPNSSMEINRTPATDGYNQYGTATLTRDNTQARSGSYNLKVVTSAINSGALSNRIPLHLANTYTVISIYVKGAVGQQGNLRNYVLNEDYTLQAEATVTTPFTLTGGWDRITLPAFTRTTNYRPGWALIMNNTGQTIYLDDWQVEPGSEVSAYYPLAIEREEGDLLAASMQYEFNGMLFGSLTPYIVENAQGLLGMEASAEDYELGLDHGTFPGFLRMGKKVMDFDLALSASIGLDIEDKVAWARRCFQVNRRSLTTELKQLTYQRLDGRKLFIPCRCTKRELPSNYELAKGLAKISVRLEAPEPFAYELEGHAVGGSMGVDVDTVTVYVSHMGDFEDGAAPIITVTGPWTNISIQNVTDGARNFQTDSVLAGGDARIIDFGEKTMVDQLGVDKTSEILSASQWFGLLPGDNTIVATRAGTNDAASAAISIFWRDTFQ